MPAPGTPPPFFEGTEKRIELDFAGAGDLRKVPRQGWDEVVRLSQTQILNTKQTDEFISFLLSESSLIVYRRKVVLKTCGRTVPISSVNCINALAEGAGLEPEWLSYSRKNFLAPSEQPKEHISQESEIAVCRKVSGGLGDAYLLGPMTGEHWFLYDATFRETDCTQHGEFHIDMMMYGLSADVRGHFFTSEPEGSRAGADAMTRKSGLDRVAALINGEIDDYSWAPCGYSCNIHAEDGSYAMVHVTPQEECSYASFETNLGSNRDPADQASDLSSSLNELFLKVLQVFQPSKFTVTLFSDQGAEEAIGGAPFEAMDGPYKRLSCTSTQLEQDYTATVVNYTLADANTHKRPAEGAAEEMTKKRSMPRMLRSRSEVTAS